MMKNINYITVLKRFAVLIFLAFSYSCNSPAVASTQIDNKEVAYVKDDSLKFEYTKHVQKQQKDICKRLKSIHKKIEKQKSKNIKQG